MQPRSNGIPNYVEIPILELKSLFRHEQTPAFDSVSTYYLLLVNY